MITLILLLVLAMYVTRSQKGPAWALLISFLICIAPIAIGAIRYNFFDDGDPEFASLLGAFIGCYLLAAWLAQRTVGVPGGRGSFDQVAECEKLRTWAVVVWFGSMLGTLLLVSDYWVLGGAGLGDLSELRDIFVSRSQASWAARLASVLTWGCLYCFGYALTFRTVLSKKGFCFFLAPVGGYFLVALLSAGRQAAFQILIISIVLMVSESAWSRRAPKRPVRQPVFVYVALSVAMVMYMGYVASARNDGIISIDKSMVLSRLFDFELNPGLQAILDQQSEGLRSAVVEGLVYFSSSIALFSKFVLQPLQSHTYGAMSLPFIMRQMEPLTGVSVIGSLLDKMDMMKDAGVIGAGWTTAFSSYILDFGYGGAFLSVAVQGFYSAYEWKRAKATGHFNDRMIALMCTLGAVYMPLIPISGETNILLLWWFCLFLRFRARHESASTRAFEVEK